MPLYEPARGYGFSNLFPKLKFSRPVGLAIPVGETNRLFVVEQTGRVMLVENLREPNLRTFLDLRESVWVTRESGLLALAFHPNFAANGRFFTYRILATPDYRFQFRLSEFRCEPSAAFADPKTERIILSDFVMDEEHNAGDLKFGLDGYLYLSIGEELTGSPESLARPQRIDQGFFGGILRIDVDGRADSLRPNPYAGKTVDYLIPKDNPFIGATNFLRRAVDPATVRTEFFAVGLRNPWRFSFDAATGRLICADVGSAYFEEINLIQSGGNYGWPYREGPLSHELAPPGSSFLPPVHALGRDEGSAVIGGLVYRGAEFPELFGKYLFADFVAGTVWARDLADPSSEAERLGARTGFSTFAHAPDGGLLLANHTDGAIYRLTFARSEIPERLSETGAFANLEALRMIDSALPFEVNSPLWSDGATKQRWVDFSRAAGRIEALTNGLWRYPAGAVWIKHFELEMTNGVPASRRRLETRLLVKTETDVYGVTYRWGDSRTEAMLVPPEGLDETLLINDGGVVRPQVWRYPSAEDCRTCHNGHGGYILGFNAQQLNRTNQIEFFASRNFFESPMDPHQLPKLAPLDDPHAPLQHRARSYLESNCVQCHQPGGRSLTDWDARHRTPLDAAHLLGSTPVFFPPPMKVVDPRRPLNSLLLNKVSNRTPGFQMPPLATAVVDRQFTNVLAQWIATMPEAGWISTNIGAALAEGAAEQHGTSLRVSSTGAGFRAGSFQFAGRKVSPTFELVSRVPRLEAESPFAEGGLAMRAGTSAIALFLKDEAILFASSAGGILASSELANWQWLKLGSTGGVTTAWLAREDKLWKMFGTSPTPQEAPLLAGFMAASAGAGAQFAIAIFDEHTLTGGVPDGPPDPVSLPPDILLQPTTVRFVGIDTNTLGSWRGRYGRDGFWLVGENRRLPEWFGAVVQGGEPSPLVFDTFLPQALLRPDGDGRFAEALFGRPSFTIDLAPLDGRPAVVGLYLLDFNFRRRVLEIAVETPAGEALDRQIASDFSRGQYLLWEIAGPARFRFTSTAFAAGMSALFVDRGFTALELLRNNRVAPSLLGGTENAFLADSDRDGISNGLEHFLGFDPFAESDSPAVYCFADGAEFSIAFTLRRLNPEVKLIFQASADLLHWQEIAPARSSVRRVGGASHLVFHFKNQGSALFVSMIPMGNIAN